MIEDIFIKMLTESIDDLRSGTLPKGKFIGKYMAQLNTLNKEEAFRYKTPQVVGFGKEPNNNWVDYILALSEEEFMYFREALIN